MSEYKPTLKSKYFRLKEYRDVNRESIFVIHKGRKSVYKSRNYSRAKAEYKKLVASMKGSKESRVVWIFS